MSAPVSPSQPSTEAEKMINGMKFDAQMKADLTSMVRLSVEAGLRQAMEIVGEMRMSEAGIFDEKHSGQRGEDRSNALYDAYQAIRAALEPEKPL